MPGPFKAPPRNCRQCGREFSSATPNAHLCSDECRQARVISHRRNRLATIRTISVAYTFKRQAAFRRRYKLHIPRSDSTK